MAEPSTFPGAPGEGEISPEPFNRQALEATLADAVRDAEIAAALAAEMGRVEDIEGAEASTAPDVESPTAPSTDTVALSAAVAPSAAAVPPSTAVAPSAAAVPPSTAVAPDPTVANDEGTADRVEAAHGQEPSASDGTVAVTPSLPPPTQAAPRAARPPRETASGAAPGPRRGLLPSGIIPAQVRADPAPTDTATPPRPRLLGSGLAGVGGPLGSGSGLHPSFGSGGSIGSASTLGSSELDSQSLSRFSAAPIGLAPLSRGLDPDPAADGTEVPTVPFRRPKRSVQAPAHPASGTDASGAEASGTEASGTEGRGAGGTDTAQPEAGPKTLSATPPRPSAPIAAWSPSDDDILPRGSARRRGWRRRR